MLTKLMMEMTRARAQPATLHINKRQTSFRMADAQQRVRHNANVFQGAAHAAHYQLILALSALYMTSKTF